MYLAEKMSDNNEKMFAHCNMSKKNDREQNLCGNIFGVDSPISFYVGGRRSKGKKHKLYCNINNSYCIQSSKKPKRNKRILRFDEFEPKFPGQDINYLDAIGGSAENKEKYDENESNVKPLNNWEIDDISNGSDSSHCDFTSVSKLDPVSLKKLTSPISVPSSFTSSASVKVVPLVNSRTPLSSKNFRKQFINLGEQLDACSSFDQRTSENQDRICSKIGGFVPDLMSTRIKKNFSAISSNHSINRNRVDGNSFITITADSSPEKCSLDINDFSPNKNDSSQHSLWNISKNNLHAEKNTLIENSSKHFERKARHLESNIDNFYENIDFDESDNEILNESVSENSRINSEQLRENKYTPLKRNSGFLILDGSPEKDVLNISGIGTPLNSVNNCKDNKTCTINSINDSSPLKKNNDIVILSDSPKKINDISPSANNLIEEYPFGLKNSILKVIDGKDARSADRSSSLNKPQGNCFSPKRIKCKSLLEDLEKDVCNTYPEKCQPYMINECVTPEKYLRTIFLEDKSSSNNPTKNLDYSESILDHVDETPKNSQDVFINDCTPVKNHNFDITNESTPTKLGNNLTATPLKKKLGSIVKSSMKNKCSVSRTLNLNDYNVSKCDEDFDINSGFEVVTESPLDSISDYGTSQNEATEDLKKYDIDSFPSPSKDTSSKMASEQTQVNTDQVENPCLTSNKVIGGIEDREEIVFIYKRKKRLLKPGTLLAKAVDAINHFKSSQKLFHYELQVGIKTIDNVGKSDLLKITNIWSDNPSTYISCNLNTLNNKSKFKSLICILNKKPKDIQLGDLVRIYYPIKIFNSNFPDHIICMPYFIEIVQNQCYINNNEHSINHETRTHKYFTSGLFNSQLGSEHSYTILQSSNSEGINDSLSNLFSS